MTASEIVPGLWVGDVFDAMAFKGYIVAVTDIGEPCMCEMLLHVQIPIMDYNYGGEKGAEEANIDALNLVAAEIDRGMHRHRDVMIHCSAGIERSPLAATWFVAGTHHMSIEDAWKLVSKRRTAAMDLLYYLRGAEPTR